MSDEIPERQNRIGGRASPALAGRALVDCISPYDERRVAARYPRSDDADVAAAVEAAQRAQPLWARMPLAERESVLLDGARSVEEAAEEIGEVIAAEMAKPLAEAEAEVRRAAAVLRFSAGEPRRPLGETFESDDPEAFLYTVHRPVGVVGMITPWNFPIAIPTWKLAPAIAYGNAVVLKPASQAPGAVLLLADCLASAGLPDGVLNIVVGSGPDVGEPLCCSPGVAAISCTSSNRVGTGVRALAAANGKPVQLEMEGHNPAVVFADADLEQAAAAIVAGAFGGAGQKCTATRRAIVERSVLAPLKERIRERTAELVVGDPFADGTTISSLIDGDAVVAFEEAVATAVAGGAQVVIGGSRHEEGALEHGHYVAPTVLEGVHPRAALACDEVFAPLLALIEFDGFEQALEIANGVRFGLSASVFTSDLGLARRFATEIQAGVVHINSQTAGADVHVPFGGTKESGYGPREQGRAARELFTKSVTVYESPPGVPA